MKIRFLFSFSLMGVAFAQQVIPANAPAVQQQAPAAPPQQAASQPQQAAASQPQGPTMDLSGERQNEDGSQTNAKLLGMEIPMLDPASDTVSYRGGFFDIGNNAVVRARFEKYLQQVPDDSTEAKRYRKKLSELLKLTQNTAHSKAAVGSETLLKIGRGLYDINDFPGDGGQSGTLASGIASALAVQFANDKRNRANKSIQKDIEKLVDDTNRLNNRNTGRGHRYSMGGKNQGNSGSLSTTNTYKIAYNAGEVATRKATQTKNDADSAAQTEMAKINYQSMILTFLFERRFDHALMGANCFRHIFRDGDNELKLDQDSKAFKLFNSIAGTAPTVSALASVAANARRDVDQNIEAVNSLLAQNKLADATQHLAEAVAIGEFMQSVRTFPVANRRRIAEYWGLRRRLLTSLNARDYGTCEDIAKRMKELDADFDDSMVMSYCAGYKQKSDLALRNAVKALKAGDEEKFDKYITEAGTIWPRNPKLAEGREQLEKIDGQDGVLEEFRTLYARGDYRTISNEQEKFEVVALDAELKAKYKEAITIVATIDAMLKQLEVAAGQDDVMGPCLAYETLQQKQKEENRYAEDARFRDALNRYASEAHAFVDALRKAKASEGRGELGSALANYYRAQCLYPRSEQAEKGIRELTRRIMRAKY